MKIIGSKLTKASEYVEVKMLVWLLSSVVLLQPTAYRDSDALELSAANLRNNSTPSQV